MFELPEYINLAAQMNATLKGKVISVGNLGNSPHKFVWYNRSPEEFTALTQGKAIAKSQAKGRWLFISLDPGYVLVFGECGGKILYHQPGSKLPKKYHLSITFEDGSFLTATTQMWGAYELYEAGKQWQRQYVKDMRPTPIDPEFTFEYFNALIDEINAKEKKSAKGLLTQDQLIPGLGNAIAQDILFKARLHPRHPVSELDQEPRRELYDSIQTTVEEVIQKGGRYDEFDLYGNPGGYVRLMDKNAVGRPCPRNDGVIEKVQYLGGACYFCSVCQK